MVNIRLHSWALLLAAHEAAAGAAAPPPSAETAVTLVGRTEWGNLIGINSVLWMEVTNLRHSPAQHPRNQLREMMMRWSVGIGFGRTGGRV